VKHNLKKNQVVITALAVIVAVAGYLNYSGVNFGKEKEMVTDEDWIESANSQQGNVDTSLIEIASLDQDYEETVEGEAALTSAENQSEINGDPVSGIPGEAVLTSVTQGAGFAANAKLSREQVRAKNKETLLQVINNENISEAQKQAAIDSMTNMTDVAEREAAAELLLDSKGFLDSVVSITDGMVDVVINQVEITEAERAQIEDVIRRKTSIAGENIVISPRTPE